MKKITYDVRPGDLVRLTTWSNSFFGRKPDAEIVIHVQKSNEESGVRLVILGPEG